MKNKTKKNKRSKHNYSNRPQTIIFISLILVIVLILLAAILRFSQIQVLFLSLIYGNNYSSVGSNGYCDVTSGHCANEVFNPNAPPKNKKPWSSDCTDLHKSCLAYKKNDECSKSPGWMTVNCAKTCGVCHLRDHSVRCNRQTLNISADPIFQPGDMNSMFSGLQSASGKKYKINVLSSSPWLVTLDDFLTERETKAMLSTASKWERNGDKNTPPLRAEDGTIMALARTSSICWCDKKCEMHPDVQSLVRKVEQLVRIPASHFETFQVVRYEPGQKYDLHHDYGNYELMPLSGPRILTLFMYLSDVAAGGETSFPRLNISIRPKRRMAVLWPSTLDDALLQRDDRTYHRADPVVSGLKYGVNTWIHPFDYHTANLWGCTGVFD